MDRRRQNRREIPSCPAGKHWQNSYFNVRRQKNIRRRKQLFHSHRNVSGSREPKPFNGISRNRALPEQPYNQRRNDLDRILIRESYSERHRPGEPSFKRRIIKHHADGVPRSQTRQHKLGASLAPVFFENRSFLYHLTSIAKSRPFCGAARIFLL